MLFATLGANFLRNLLTDKTVQQPNSFNVHGIWVIRASKCTIKAG